MSQAPAAPPWGWGGWVGGILGDGRWPKAVIQKTRQPSPRIWKPQVYPPQMCTPPLHDAHARHHAAAGTRPHRATTRNARLHAATRAISTTLAQDGQAKQSRSSITRAAPCLYRTGQHRAFQQTTSSSPSALPCPRMLGEPKRARKSTGDNLASGSVEAQCDPPALNPQFQ